MNLALPALIAFVVFLPGFVVRSRFKRVERVSLDYSPFGQVATEAVLWAAMLHAAWLCVSAWLLERPLRADVFLKLLSSDGPSQAWAVDAVAADVLYVVAYFASLLVVAYLAPAIARRLIVRFSLDRAEGRWSGLFRFHQAPWYYLLTGADFTENDKPDFISVSAVVNVAGQAMLYTGILDEFFVAPDGSLDRLVLQEVMRRPLQADKSHQPSADGSAEEPRFYPVDGDYFVLRYSEAITLNVEYIKLVPSGAGGAAG
ncbi:hypothetical protein [Caldimonas brevitalea]|uniref:Uncharacterized protein n=1 Tax=Caldimonas brevitalea TaxID=413882 RepID=A0A0G3BJC9_9BURK|nr:hypothetical protein [Caldimonas brevitalea]AKJ29482.1 hypothetical protein AAW51_2791 [Caldimonas brevitalea]